MRRLPGQEGKIIDLVRQAAESEAWPYDAVFARLGKCRAWMAIAAGRRILALPTRRRRRTVGVVTALGREEVMKQAGRHRSRACASSR